MTTLSAIYEDFLFEIRHNLLEPFASCQLGSVFPSSCLLAKSGKQSRDAFTGSVLRFADGSLWVCPLHDSIFPPRVGEARLMEVRLVPMAGGEGVRVDAAVLDSSKPAVLLGVLCSDEAGASAAPSMQRRGARAGTVRCRETGSPWRLTWPAAGGIDTVTVTVQDGSDDTMMMHINDVVDLSSLEWANWAGDAPQMSEEQLDAYAATEVVPRGHGTGVTVATSQ